MNEEKVVAGLYDKVILHGDNLVWRRSVKGAKVQMSFINDYANDLMKEVIKDSKKLGLIVDDEVIFDVPSQILYYVSDFIGNKPEVIESAKKIGFSEF